MTIVPWSMRLTLALSLLFAFVGCGSSRTERPTLGQPAPDFTLPTLNTTPVRLADLRGKVVVVNFWASWCPPCVNETPRLVEWQAQHGSEGLQVLGIDTLYQDSRDDVEQFVKDYQVRYPVLLDDFGDVSKQWEARQLPRSYVIDREGVVRYVRIGELTEDDFQAQVLPLLQAP